MNPLHSPEERTQYNGIRKEEFRGKVGESETFYPSKFSPATGVSEHETVVVCLFFCLFVCWNKTRKTILRLLVQCIVWYLTNFIQDVFPVILLDTIC